jgi:hypothetical protein
VRQMVSETVTRLERSGIGTNHPGSRYSQLLRLLWDKVDRKEHRRTQSMATLANPYRPNTSGQTPGSAHSASVHESPAMAELMGDFSWTDLDAIGNFAVNGNNGNNANEIEWWSGFLPTDSSNFMLDTFSGMNDWDLGLGV